VVTPLVGLGLMEVETGGTALLVVVTGVGVGVTTGTGIPQFCSTQYEFPVTKVHADVTDGF